MADNMAEKNLNDLSLKTLGTEIKNPNDPRFKQQNELRFIISILEFTEFEHQALEKMRQQWILEAQSSLGKKSSNDFVYDEKRISTVTDKPQTETEKAQHRIEEIKINLDTLIGASKQIALRAVDTAFANDPQLHAIATKMVSNIFTPQLRQKTAKILDGINDGTISLSNLLPNAHPIKHEEITALFNKVKNATTTQEALENALVLTTVLESAAVMKTELKREPASVVTGREATDSEMKQVQNADKDMLLITPDTATLVYATKDGETQKLPLTEDTELSQTIDEFVNEQAEKEGEMGIRLLTGEKTDRTYLSTTKLSESQNERLSKQLDAAIERAGGSSVGQKKTEQARQLDDFTKTVTTPIALSTAAGILRIADSAREDPVIMNAIVSKIEPMPILPKKTKEESKQEEKDKLRSIKREKKEATREGKTTKAAAKEAKLVIAQSTGVATGPNGELSSEKPKPDNIIKPKL